MNEQRLLDKVEQWSGDTVETVVATTFSFDPDFFLTGVLTTLAGLRGGAGSHQAAVRERLGNPLVTVVQGAPSSGPSPAWIQRYLWPTRRAGLLHAKCLLVVTPQRIHAYLGSANLTPGSWWSNREVAVTLTASREERTDESGKVAALIDGLIKVCNTVDAADTATTLTDVRQPLGTVTDEVLWTGLGTRLSVLDAVPSGTRVVVMSPFWPESAPAARRLLRELNKVAEEVVLVPRSRPTGELELPDEMVAAIRSAPGTKVTSVDNGTSNGDSIPRRLHAKQIAVSTETGEVSYIGSANATLRGLSLTPTRPNIELGLVWPIGPLIAREPAKPVDSWKIVSPQPDPDDPGYIDSCADLWGQARLHGTVLEIELDHDLDLATLGAEIRLATTPDAPPRLMNTSCRSFDLSDSERRLLLAQPELDVRVNSSDQPTLIPVLVHPGDQVSVRPGFDTGTIDDFLISSRHGTATPPDTPTDEPEPDRPSARPSPPVSDPGRRLQIHRARDVIETIGRLERDLTEFAKEAPPRRLADLRTNGPRGPVELGRRLHERRGQRDGLTLTATAFSINELVLMASRLERLNEHMRPAAKRAITTLTELRDSAFDEIDSTSRRQLRQIARKARP